MWFSLLCAFAGVVTTVELDDGSARVVRAVRTSSPARATGWGVPAHDPRLRSFDGEAVTVERALFRVRVPDGSVLADLPRAAPTAERVHGGAPSTDRLDLLVLAEGYTAEQSAEFAADTEALVAELLRTEPYDRYGHLLNVWRSAVVSDESGASKDTRFETVSVDTALSCTYGCGGADRIVCCDDDAVFAAVDEALPDADAVFVLVNDDEYGGAGAFTYGVSYTGPDWLPVAVHELGHVLGELYDEYDYGYASAGYAPNCAPFPAFVPWNEWLGEPGIGAFERCTYTNLYRPTESGCRMRELDGPFCPICREALVRSLVAHLPPLLVAPAEVAPGSSVSVEAAADATVEWRADDAVFATGLTATLPTCGTITVTARVASDWVRDDPEQVTSDTRSWDLGACPRTCSVQPTAAVPVLSFARRR
ncbi:MAG: M64 family metallopeptidase [Myxococcota bacterium]